MKTAISFFSFIIGLCVVAVLGFGGLTQAAVVDGTCVEDSGLNCTANEVPLAGPDVNILDGCSFPGDTATIELFFDADANTNRYDIGLWVSTDGDPNGDGSKSGACSVISLDMPPADDLDGDSCGDIDGSSTFTNLNVGTITVVCNDSDNDGNINIPILMTWDQNAGGTCNGPMDTLPGTPSKCKLDNDYTLPVPVPGQIIIEKQTSPDGDATDFDFNLLGNSENENFILSDDETWESGTDGPILFAAEYTITEADEAGWTLTDISCTSNDGSIVTPVTDGVTVDLLPGDIVTCVFTNTIDAYCGDGNTNQPNEECDDGANGDDTDGCNDSCEITTNGVCGSVDGTDMYDFDNSGNSLTAGSANLCSVGSVTNFTYDTVNHTWTWDCMGDGGSNALACTATETYCGDTLTQVAEDCDDGANGDDADGCNDSCELTDNGECGSVDGTDMYDFDNSGNSLTAGSANLCSVGTVTNFAYDTNTHTWTWDCTGVNGGSAALACSAGETYCGDTLTQVAEDCDDGANGDDADGCNDSCELTDNGECGGADGQTYYGENNLTNTSTDLCIIGDVSSFTGPDANGGYSWTCDGVNGGDSINCSADENWCGDDITNGAETCDDGANNGQPNFCNSTCTGTTSPTCGNNTIEAGEDCDDGANGDDTDACDDSCMFTFCGDGIIQSINGEGVTEECDDGNSNPNDGCNDSCEITTNGVCGSVDGTDIYDFDNSGDSLNAGSNNLCDSGTVDNFDYDTNTHMWTWDCVGDGGSDDLACTASEEWCGDTIVNGQEACDDGADGDATDGCNDSCQTTTNGVCGSVDGTNIYDFDNSGDSLTSGSLNLCAGGTITNFAYDTNTHTWTWDCVGAGGSDDLACSAGELYCGDGIINGQEACDDGNNRDGDGCSARCTLEFISCQDVQFTLTPNAGYAPLLVSGSFVNNTGFSVISLDWGVSGAVVNNPISPQTYTYDLGNYTGTLTIVNNLSGAYTTVCELPVVASNAPINGLCGSVYGNGVYDFDNSGDAINANSTNLCDIGTADNFLYNTGSHTWTWDCLGLYEGGTDSCTVDELWCGDGITNGTETCDDGNNRDGDGCSATCARERNGGGGGGGGSPTVCGDGNVDRGEECDDGNIVSGDGCSISCTIEEENLPPELLDTGNSSEPLAPRTSEALPFILPPILFETGAYPLFTESGRINIGMILLFIIISSMISFGAVESIKYMIKK